MGILSEELNEKSHTKSFCVYICMYTHTCLYSLCIHMQVLFAVHTYILYIIHTTSFISKYI